MVSGFTPFRAPILSSSCRDGESCVRALASTVFGLGVNQQLQDVLNSTQMSCRRKEKIWLGTLPTLFVDSWAYEKASSCFCTFTNRVFAVSNEPCIDACLTGLWLSVSRSVSTMRRLRLFSRRQLNFVRQRNACPWHWCCLGLPLNIFSKL